MVLRDKRILLGITGGIAAYKAAELCRLLGKSGCAVRVVMTPSATRFVSPLTFEALSGNAVGVDLFDGAMPHTSFGREADAIVVAPATADFMARVNAGLADDLLPCAILASGAPVLLAPAMNVEMWNNAITQRNVKSLLSLGRFHVVPPGVGELACGVVGAGRMAEPAEVIEELRALLAPKDLAGVGLLVTAGPSREHIDPVRFLSNPSTGRMGVALARAARLRGADVLLILGPGEAAPPAGAELVRVEAAGDFLSAVREHLPGRRVLMMAAAVSDFRPVRRATHKVHKASAATSLDLERTEDVLLSVRPAFSGVAVGFAAETEKMEESAREKLERKGLDLIFGNRVGGEGSAFGSLSTSGVLLGRDGLRVEMAEAPKEVIADRILDAVVKLLK